MEHRPGRERQPHEHRDRPRQRGPGRRGDPHRRGARLRRGAASALRPAPSSSCSPRAHERRERIARGGAARLPARDRRASATPTGIVPPPPPALVDRRVEITGPASPAKMAINALNSGARVWLADLEDASSPTWPNVVGSVLQPARCRARHPRLHVARGQGVRAPHRRRAARRSSRRPRGWHLPEKHVLVDGERGSGSLVDFGLHFFHTAQQLIDNGDGPFFYLPKLESHLEARLWNDVFTFAEEALGIPHGTVRATVLIETIPAAFEMDEILYELREHASGLNAGRWDYLFSIIKVFRDAGPEFVVPDRADVHDDRAVHARLHRAAREDLPPTRRGRDGRHGGVRARTAPTPRSTAVALREGARRQDPRGERRLRRLVGRASRSRAGLPRGVRRACSATGPTSSTGSGPRSR